MSLFHSRKDAYALASVCLAALMFALEISSVPVILSTLEKVLHGDLKDMQWIMNAYTIACTTVLMAAGTLADRYGRKRMFIICLTCFGITSLICGLATSMPTLIAARFLQGMSGGAMTICLMAILSHQFQDRAMRSRAFGAFGIMLGVGLGFGPLIGGAIVALLNWQWVFLVHVPLTVLTVLLAYRGIKESRDPHAKKLDLLGIMTLSISVFGLTYFITQGADLGFSSLPALIIIAITVCSFVAFIIVEKSRTHPMFDFSVFKSRDFSGAIMGSIGMNFSFWPFIIYLPLYFQSALGYDAIHAGLALLAYTLPTLIVPPFAERLSLRYQPRLVIPAGLFMIGLGFMLMRYASGLQDASWLTMLPGSLLAGIGLGLTNTPVTNTATASVSSSRAGMASGIDMSARLITLAINIALMGFILLESVLASLKNSVAGIVSDTQLRLAAEMVAAGNLSGLAQRIPEIVRLDDAEALLHTALVHGFGTVMLYGGIGVWILAGLSYVIFGQKIAHQTASAEVGEPL